jgi:hypothetical protein
VLAGARKRLALEDDEARRLETLVAGRLLDVALARPWHRSARAVSTYAVAHLPAESRSGARGRRARALVVGPLRASGRRALRLAVELPGLTSLRAYARRSRIARRLYGKAIGSE